MRRTRSDLTNSRPATAGLFLSGNCHRVNTTLFTLHRIFTLYHYEIIDKKAKVNSVNSKTQKNFLSPPHNHRIAVMVAGNRPETR
ncbi:TPA: hypothetical protein OMW05_000832 [Enterobacter hormaechei]|uniref:hypothetical protein n=1 Tax=Enterobacter hormaechei TaxID=158836 RepID=UPI000F66711D|nr:hypothetical protein [Enterobacter hormaechei]ELC7276026.1 hypothetical protein [Enterobacter hormaechei]MCM7738163.1 hypothetical protein [Enterobacter hormaechei]MDK5191453.1 hypothetical protein [Enterobacter hormaechei]MDK5217040.1 hypothetical protein [Enterobacter hormaechei]MDK5247163.1 hypothetical protein [Enterobacter hormaechei]